MRITGHHTLVARSFLLSTVALGVEETTRDFLGKWNAQGSDRYARVAKLRVLNVQSSVLNVIKAPGAENPITDSDTLREYMELLKSTTLTDEQRSSLVRAMHVCAVHCGVFWPLESPSSAGRRQCVSRRRPFPTRSRMTSSYVWLRPPGHIQTHPFVDQLRDGCSKAATSLTAGLALVSKR